MRLRTLKKLSKLAAPILLQHFGRAPKSMFYADKGDNYHGLIIRCPHKPGRFRCDCAVHPLKGTPMIGGVQGHEEPEWEEQTAWEELAKAVTWEGRPATMTDKEWDRCLRITRARPLTEEELLAWEPPAPAGEGWKLAWKAEDEDGCNVVFWRDNPAAVAEKALQKIAEITATLANGAVCPEGNGMALAFCSDSIARLAELRPLVRILINRSLDGADLGKRSTPSEDAAYA